MSPPAPIEAKPVPPLAVPPTTPAPGAISAKPVKVDDQPKPAATRIVVGPGAAMPTPPGPPAVERYRVHAVLAVEGETWASFSRKYYGDERCAEALREFNRNYGFASPRLRQDGRVLAGDTVHIPALKILLERHRSLIREEKSASSATTPTTRPLQ